MENLTSWLINSLGGLLNLWLSWFLSGSLWLFSSTGGLLGAELFKELLATGLRSVLSQLGVLLGLRAGLALLALLWEALLDGSSGGCGGSSNNSSWLGCLYD